MSTATLELPCDRSAAFQARRWVMQQHLRWQFAGRGPEHLFDDLVLCVSELVTTAIEANSSSIVLALDSTADVVRLSMFDHSPDAEAAARMQRNSNDHRARIIEAVASRWGVDPVPDNGDEIWVEFELTAPGRRGA